MKTNNGSGTRSGGVGANGQIKITYTLPANTVTTTNPSQTRCINTALTPNITHTTTGATGISNSGVSGANGLPAGVSATWSGNTITITGTPTASGTFNYSIPMTGGCTIGQLPATGTITVTPNQTVGAASSTPTLCINTGLVANITHATTNSTGIANNGVAGANGLPAGVSASWVGNTITISGTPTASGTFNYSIPVIGCLASGVIATGTITVTPNNTVGAASSTPTLCINTALTNITHSTTGATGIGVATGLPAGVSAAWSGNVITISGTPTASGTFNYSIPLTGGCNTPAVNATGTITVTPNNTVAAASSTPTLCINTALTNITHATVGATGIGAATGLPAGVSAAWSGNVITISGTPTASGTFNYSIPLSGGCNTPAVNATGTITVTPNNTVAAASSTPILCINTALTNITHATVGATGIGAATGLPAGVSAAWSGNVITISGTPTASGTFNYSIPLSGGCNMPAVNATGTITVTPNNTVAAASSTPTLCINTALTNITHATTGATGIGAATGLPAGVSAAWSGNVITISGTPTASGTFNYSIPLTGGCNTPAVNATGTFTVSPNNTVAAASSTPTLCISTALTNITHATVGATGIGAATGLPTGVTASWAGNVITISGTPTSSGTFNYSIPLTGGCLATAVSATGTITVNPATIIVSESLAAQSICIGQNFTSISISATGTGTLTYQWYRNTVSNNTSGTAIVGTNSPSYTPASTPSGTSYYYVTVSSSCGPIRTSGVSGAFIVDPITLITTQPDDSGEIECFGDGFDPISVDAIGGDLSYQWYKNADSLNTGGTAVPGAQLASFTPPSIILGELFYYVVVTGNCGNATSNVSGKYRVNPPVTVIDLAPSPDDKTICLGDSFAPITALASGEGTVSYQWYRNASNSNSGGTLISGATLPSYTPPSTPVGTTYYYVVAKSNCGTVPSDVSGAFTITPLTSINTQSLATQTICFTETFNPISVTASGTGTLSYQWYKNTANNNTTGTAIPGEDLPSFTPPSSSTGTNFYYVIVSSGCGPDQISNPSGAFTVTPTNTTGTPSANPTICINTALTNITHATTGATGIGAATGLPAGVSAAWSGNVITISGTPTASGTFNYSIPLTGGCNTPVINATGTITVTPNNTVGAASSTPTLCINTALTNITHATTGATGIGAATGLPAGVSAAWSGNVITISGTPTASGTFNYSIPLSGGCNTPAVNATGSITVTPNNTVAAASSTPTLCINTALTNITHATVGATGIGAATGLPAGVSATWSGNVITISGTPTASGTFNYSIPLSGGCNTPAVNATGTFTVTPNNTVGAASSTSTLCINTALTNITHATVGATGIGAATGLPAGVSAAWSGNVITISGTPTASGTFNYSIPLSGGCNTPAVNATGTITVTPNNTVAAASSTPTLCINTALTNITHATVGATGIGAATGLPAGVSAAWSGNVITISGTPTASGTFNYYIPLSGGCNTPAVNATGTITVTQNNTVATASSTPTLCINTALTNITHATTGATGIGAATGLPTGVTASWASNTITISGTPTTSGTFNYSIPLTGGCNTPAVNATGTIIVTPNNTVGTASSTPTLCINTALTNITHATTGATGIGVITGLPTGVTAAWSGNLITISGTPTTSGTFNYSIRLTGGCNTPIVSATGTITVTPNNTVTSASPNQTRCINSALANITHSTTGATGIGVATGLPAGVSAAWSGNVITISGTPTASGTFNYSIPLIGGCNTPAVNATGTITVTAANTVSVASSSPILCIYTPVTPITHTTTGATGIGAAIGLPGGVTASRSGNTITISGTPFVSGTFNYSIPLTGGCGSVAATGTLIVTPNNTVGGASSTPTLCISTPLTNITHTTSGATGIGSVTNLPAGVSAAWSGDIITISGTPTVSGTFNYSIPLTGGCNIPAVNATGTITVTPNNTVTSSAPNQTVCINNALNNIIHATTGATGIGAATGFPLGVTAAWSGNTITISGTPTQSGTFNYSIPLSGGCNTPAVNATGTITITPNNTVGTASTAPTLCINTPLTNITHATTGATGIGAATGLPAGVSAAWSGNVITISGTPTASGTFNYSIPLTGSCNTPAVNAIGTITVNPATTIVSESLAAQSICIGQNFTGISISATGTGTLTYQWYGNTVNNNTSGTAITGAISPSYTPPSSLLGTNYYYVTVTSSCGPIKTSSVSGAFIVDPITSITTQPDDTGEFDCFGDGFDPISVVAKGGDLTYQWYKNTAALNTGGIAMTGPQMATFTPPSTILGNSYYYVIVTGNCGTEISNVSGLYTVNEPETTIIQHPSTDSETSCQGGIPFSELIVEAQGEPSVTYQWYSNSSPSNTGGTLISGATLPNFTPPTTSVGTFYYYATGSSACGTVPTDVSGAFTVTPLTNIDSESLAAQTICFTDNFTPISVTASGSGTLSYQWYKNTVNNNTTGTLISGANLPSYIPPSSSTGTNFYYIIVSSECGPAQISNPSGAFTVTPTNTAGAASSTPTLCINTVLNNITHTTTGATGIGAVTGLPAGITAAWVGNSITISGTPIESGTFNYTLPLTGGCGAVAATGTIIVEPIATVSLPSVTFPSVCITSPTLSPFTQTTTGVTAIGVPTGLPPGISASFNSTTGLITFSGTATTIGLYSYSIPLVGNCVYGLNATGTIDVTPVYNITSVSSVSASSIGGAATVTFYGNPATILDGTYKITYQIKQASGAFTTVGPVDATVVNGKGTFTTIPINSNVDTYTVQILTIKKSTDFCTVTLTTPPTTYFGVCSAVFGSNSTFYVPAGVFSVTIEVYGGGGGGNGGGGGGGGYSILKNIPVTPGESLAAFVGNGGGQGQNGGVSYVTRDSNIANQLGNSLVLANGGNGSTAGNAAGGTFDPRYTGSNGNPSSGTNGGKGAGPSGGNGGTSGNNGTSPGGGGGNWSSGKGIGGNGLIVISYSCPDSDISDCIKVIDDGSKSGSGIIEFSCDYSWTAPEGLQSFTVIVGSGGGGGGSGFGSGGGGSGALILQKFSTSNPYGLPANATFPITVGQGGNGAVGGTNPGFTGNPSTFSGTIDGSSINISVHGGGGGGSQSSIGGANGASGGGGGARPNPGAQAGVGGSSIPIVYSGTDVILYQGNKAGDGAHSNSQNSIAGGGGGGLVAFVPSDRPNGKASGNGQGEGGDGGKGVSLTMGDSLRQFGAGGGGIGEYFNGTEKVGIGGSANGVKLGGDGNLANPSAIGGAGKNKTGSGGGAGYGGGGRGGNGVVYIYFDILRILSVEYLYFNATYNREERSGLLEWATSKEWENSGFEIERSVNNTNDWEKIGENAGSGYTDAATAYSFTDKELPASGGNVFYRLKQVDFDGSFGYSVVKSIQVAALKGKSNWVAYPNPSSSGDYVVIDLLDLSAYNDEPIVMLISDVKGVSRTYTLKQPNEVSEVVNDYLDQAHVGLYIVQLIWGEQNQQLKLMRK
ncbi:hypothetical protein ESW18_14160 [Algoriphagus ratkowskyi]|uniref:Gliding motility-associated-like protein n=1 Tax=Algoriphagus ratkowskyi TaxID=57028 RepID=A0ABY3HLJ2_9BACT|nr:hypothetical protein ESW18_14160 [Algoriphagus ratkowskyi]